MVNSRPILLQIHALYWGPHLAFGISASILFGFILKAVLQSGSAAHSEVLALDLDTAIEPPKNIEWLTSVSPSYAPFGELLPVVEQTQITTNKALNMVLIGIILDNNAQLNSAIIRPEGKPAGRVFVGEEIDSNATITKIDKNGVEIEYLGNIQLIAAPYTQVNKSHRAQGNTRAQRILDLQQKESTSPQESRQPENSLLNQLRARLNQDK